LIVLIGQLIGRGIKRGEELIDGIPIAKGIEGKEESFLGMKTHCFGKRYYDA
jgi:hypothetical protein